MMESENSTIVYSNDGSGMCSVGNYVVQYVIINGTQRTLRTMNIFTESRGSLAELEKSTVETVKALNKSIIVKALKCLSSFINKEFSGKPWNRSSDFKSFIAP